MKKYRTKSGKVEEKLPGVNATVNPSEKTQIAMAGGADTLKDVQTILGHEGKRNNLKKGQGAKHLVSFAYGDPDDDETGAANTFGGVEVGSNFGVEGATEGVFAAGADPSAVEALGYSTSAIEGYDDYKTDPRGTEEGARAAVKDALLDKDTYTARTTELKSTRAVNKSAAIAKQAILDMNKDEREYDEPGRSVLTTKQDVKDRVAKSWEDANTLRTRTEVLTDMRKYGSPEDLTGLVRSDFMGPPTLNQAKNIERRQEARGVKGLGWAKDKLDEFTLPGVEKSIGYNRKTAKYGVKTDPTDLIVGGLLTVATGGLAAAGAIPAASEQVLSVARGVHSGIKALNAPSGYLSTDPNRPNYQRDTPDYPDTRIQTPPSPPPSDSGDTKPLIPKVVKSVSNNVTLAAIKPEDKRASRGRLREWRSRGISF